MAERTKTRVRRHTATPRPEGDASPTYLQVAGDAFLAGMTREQVIAGLISRIKRDQGYLAYRKACNRRTGYDDQVQQDMLALVLAAVLLQNGDLPLPSHGFMRDSHLHLRALAEVSADGDADSQQAQPENNNKQGDAESPGGEEEEPTIEHRSDPCEDQQHAKNTAQHGTHLLRNAPRARPYDGDARTRDVSSIPKPRKW